MIVDDSALIHGEAYDPQKAREYYLRTRKLKGRKKGSGDPEPSGRNSAGSKASTSRTRKPKKTSAQKRKEAEAQVAALEKRLERLKDVLAELVKKAKARSGVEDSKSSSPKDRAKQNADEKARKPLTAKQKREAAERSKKNYEENKKTPNQEIKELQAKIKAIRAQIKAAIAASKKQSSKSQTAPKGR